jgi:hypothetical protein
MNFGKVQDITLMITNNDLFLGDPKEDKLTKNNWEG